MQALNVQNPCAPCFMQRPRACAAVSHPAVEQNPFEPCFKQRPCDLALLPQPSAEQATLSVECLKHTSFPFLAFLVHAGAVQIPLAPCLAHAKPPAIAAVVQCRSAHDPCIPPCFLQWPPFFCAFVAHPFDLHLPFAPCLLHTPLAIALVVQPSLEQGSLPCLPQSPLA